MEHRWLDIQEAAQRDTTAGVRHQSAPAVVSGSSTLIKAQSLIHAGATFHGIFEKSGSDAAGFLLTLGQPAALQSCGAADCRVRQPCGTGLLQNTFHCHVTGQLHSVIHFPCLQSRPNITHLSREILCPTCLLLWTAVIFSNSYTKTRNSFLSDSSPGSVADFFRHEWRNSAKI